MQGKREIYYKKLKEISASIRKEWNEITKSSAGVVKYFMFIKSLQSTITEIKKAREQEYDVTAKTSEIAKSLTTTHDVILQSLKSEIKEAKEISKEYKVQTNELKAQQGIINKLKNTKVGIVFTQGFETLKSKGKDVINETISKLVTSIRGLLPIVDTAIIAVSGVVNGLVAGITNGVEKLFTAISENGINGIKSGLKGLASGFAEASDSIANTFKNIKEVFFALKEIQRLEAQVSERENILAISQKRLELFEVEKNILEQQNLSLQEQISLIEKQAAHESDVIKAQQAVLVSKNALIEKEIFLATVKQESTKAKQSELRANLQELSILQKKQQLIQSITAAQKVAVLLANIQSKAQVDIAKTLYETDTILKNIAAQAGGINIETEISLTNKAIDTLKKQLQEQISEIEKTVGTLPINIDNLLPLPIIEKQLSEIKSLNKDSVQTILSIYSVYYEQITALQQQAFDKNRVLIERNEAATKELILLEYEQRKAAIEQQKNLYINIDDVITDIDNSTEALLIKTIQYVNAYKRGYNEANKEIQDNLDKITALQELIAETVRLQEYELSLIERRTDLTEREKELERERIKQKYEADRNELQNTILDVENKNKELAKKQEQYLASARQKIMEYVANVANTIASLFDSVSTAIAEKLDKQSSRLDTYISRLHQMKQINDTLLQQGSALQLDSINREIVKAEQEKRRLDKQKEALNLLNSFIQTYNSYLQGGAKPQTALMNTVRDMIVVKALSKAIAGKFAQGVENFDGKGTETSDSNLVLISKGESIITAQATRKYKGLATAMNKGTVEQYLANNYNTYFGNNVDFLTFGNSIIKRVKHGNKYRIK